MEDRDLRELQAHVDRLEAELAELRRCPGVQLRRLLACLPSSRRARLTLMAAVLVVATASYAATVSMPYTFSNGTIADANQVNANFNTLVAESNDQDSRLASLEADVATIFADGAVLMGSVTTNTANIATNTGQLLINTPAIGVNAADIGALQTDVGTNTGNIATNTTAIASNGTDIGTLNTTFADVSRGGTPDTLTFSGMNVQVIDGSGDTEGTVNGLGNLIVGYNENAYSLPRTGSHNLVVGRWNGYSSYGGLVAGVRNTISGDFASVSGGYYNEAGSSEASISGGTNNTATGAYSSVSGGYGNTASGDRSSVTGGYGNEASGDYSSVTGGLSNVASNTYSGVSGGRDNDASSTHSVVSGGRDNTAIGSYDAVLGSNIIEYTVLATSTTEVTTTTSVHEYCALEKIRLLTGDPSTNKWCSITQNGDGTWTVGARGGNTSGDIECIAICQ